MHRQELERAIVDLGALLAGEVQREADYQALFERAGLLETLGYTRVIPQPRLVTETGELFIPDFLALRQGQWEILDLKTPDVPLLVERQRRKAFRAPMTSFIGQVRDYIEFFDAPENREAVKRAYDADVAKFPRAVLIAGRSAAVDPAELARQSYYAGVRIITFDDILAALEDAHRLHHGEVYDAAGMEVVTWVLLDEALRRRRGYVWQIGAVATGRLGLLSTGCGEIALELEVEGHSTRSAVLRPDGPGDLFAQMLPVFATWASGPSSTYLRLAVGSSPPAEATGPPMPIGPVQMAGMTVGADQAGRERLMGLLGSLAIYGRALTFGERLGLSDWSEGRG